MPTPAQAELIAETAARHGFTVAAASVMLNALIAGGGTMAQFNDPEFAGPGQWMRGGMTMVSDMFNASLAARIDELCTDLSNLLERPEFQRSVSMRPNSSRPEEPENDGDAVVVRFPSNPVIPGAWWPLSLGIPTSTGGQNGMRYAYFARIHRLGLDIGGRVTVYDTLDHSISGFSQQQSIGGTIMFTSQRGPINVASLPVAPLPATD